MDKQTLSNYGWIVICILVLSVMIAFATPFASFIGDGFKSITSGFFDTSKKALEVVGMNLPDQEFEYTPSDKTPVSCGIYIDAGGTIYNSCDTLPETVRDMDMYLFGDYIYVYMEHGIEIDVSGWWVHLATSDIVVNMLGFTDYPYVNTNQTTYGAILENINGEPVTSLNRTFQNCTSLESAPMIPNGIADMFQTFSLCSSLKTAPTIPGSVICMGQAFEFCTSLTVAPDLSNATSLADMGCAFTDCSSLTTIPVIPNSVTNLDRTFRGCVALSGIIEIPVACQGQDIGYANVIYK